MGLIYAYSPTETDCATLGLCGALLPTKCEFSLKAGSYPEITITHPKDEYGKWNALKNGVKLRVPSPVRYSPDFDDNDQYVRTIETWVTRSDTSGKERRVYTKAKDGSSVGTVPKGVTVTVTQIGYNDTRNKIKAKWKSGKTNKSISGWIEKDSLERKISEAEITNPGQSSTEAFATSFTVRDQLYRIYDVNVTDSSSGQITVKARHIVYDLLGNLSTYATNSKTASVTCAAACKSILDSTIYPHDFVVHCDDLSTQTYIDARNKNPIEALCADEDGVISKWANETVVDNYDIYVLSRAGMDRGVELRYAKNITGITCDTDVSGVATAVRPVGEKKSGAMLYLDGAVDSKGRHVYNYDSTAKKRKSTLPDGYHFLVHDDGTVDGSVIVRAEQRVDYHVPKLTAITVSEAKVSDDLNTNDARIKMAYAAIAEFDKDIDIEKISLTVKFVMLGDTEEYSQYKGLENLFIYDRVRVSHIPLGITTALDLVSITWDCITDRALTATFGTLQTSTATIPSSQISSVNGGKIVNGTISAGSISDGAISSQHIQAESITVDALVGKAITSDWISAGAIKTEQLDANAVTTDKINAGAVTASKLDTTSVSTAFADIADAHIGNASIDYAQIKEGHFDHATADSLIVKDGTADVYYIKKLAATSAQILNLMVGMLVVKGDDDNYYQITVSVGTDGSIGLRPTLYTGEVDEEKGVTSDGSKYVFQDTMNVDDLYANTLRAANAIITKLTVGELFADSAFIGRLKTSQIFTEGSLTIQQLHDDTKATTDEITEKVNEFTEWDKFIQYFDIDTNKGLIIRGFLPSGAQSKFYTLTNHMGYHIMSTEKARALGTFDALGLDTVGVRISTIRARQTSKGWAWVVG